LSRVGLETDDSRRALGRERGQRVNDQVIVIANFQETRLSRALDRTKAAPFSFIGRGKRNRM